MIGVDSFSSVFGGAPAHTETHWTEHIRAIIRAGYSPVLCKPGTPEAGCILTPGQYKKAGKHPCGYLHVIDNPAKVGAVVSYWLSKYGGLNVGLHLGRSNMAVLKQPAGPGMTVEAPGGIGHTWFTLPPGTTFPKVLQGADWSIKHGDRYVLVPPARLSTGAHRLVGGTIAAPEWLLAAAL